MLGLLSPQLLLYSLPLLWLNRGLGREAPNLPWWHSPGPLPEPPQTHLVRSPSWYALPTPCPPCTTWSRARAVPPCKLDLTLVPTGPSPGLSPSLLLAGHPAGSPHATQGTPSPPASSGVGAESCSLCTLLCRALAARSLSVLRGRRVIKWDGFLFYSFARCGLSLCCRGRRAAQGRECPLLDPQPHINGDLPRDTPIPWMCQMGLADGTVARSLFWEPLAVHV